MNRKFVCLRVRGQYRMIGLWFAASLIILAVTALIGGSHKYNVSGTMAFVIPCLIVCGVFVYRGTTGALVTLGTETFTYRSMCRTRTIARNNISTVHSGLRFRSARQWSQPGIVLKSGEEIWLAEFSVSPNSYFNEIRSIEYLGSGSEKTYETLEDMVTALNEWIHGALSVSSRPAVTDFLHPSGPSATVPEHMTSWVRSNAYLSLVLYGQALFIGIIIFVDLIRSHGPTVAVAFGAGWVLIDAGIVTVAIERMRIRGRAAPESTDHSAMMVTYGTEGWTITQREELEAALIAANVPHVWNGTDLNVDGGFERDVDRLLDTQFRS